MTALRTSIPFRATMLIDEPEVAVRRALARADVWTRTARAAGARAEVSDRTDARAPLREGELIRVWADRAPPRSVAGSGMAAAGTPGTPGTAGTAGTAGTGGTAGTAGAAGTARTAGSARTAGTAGLAGTAGTAVRAALWPARSLIFRVALDRDAGVGAEGRNPLPVLELLVGPLKSCRISLTTAATGAGTLVTVDCRVQAAPAVLTPLFRRRILGSAQLLLGIAMLAAREVQVVVGGAVIEHGKVLAARRTSPPELAGRWELPGGKVDPGETEQGALARELAEELGLVVTVGDRLGAEVDLGDNMVLRCYRVKVWSGEPLSTDHDALAWLGVDELASVDWLEPDLVLLPQLSALLRG